MLPKEKRQELIRIARSFQELGYEGRRCRRSRPGSADRGDALRYFSAKRICSGRARHDVSEEA